MINALTYLQRRAELEHRVGQGPALGEAEAVCAA
jgi:hypothetical protein